VRLASSDDSSVVDIAIDGYQFPSQKPAGIHDYDANWLMISGAVVTQDRSWTFRDPCLTTWEISELRGWLWSVANGRVDPQPTGAGPGHRDFTEPNIEVRLQERGDDFVALDFIFFAESAPPGVTEDVQFDDGYPVRIRVDLATLLIASEELAREKAQWPPR